MSERLIGKEDLKRIVQQWQEENRNVEVRLRFADGVTQTHAGYVTMEPDGRIVVAHVLDKHNYFTTVIEISAFPTVKIFETENAITLSEWSDSPGAIKSITIACRDS